jgi:hypothetical protein
MSHGGGNRTTTGNCTLSRDPPQAALATATPPSSSANMTSRSRGALRSRCAWSGWPARPHRRPRASSRRKPRPPAFPWSLKLKRTLLHFGGGSVTGICGDLFGTPPTAILAAGLYEASPEGEKTSWSELTCDILGDCSAYPQAQRGKAADCGLPAVKRPRPFVTARGLLIKTAMPRLVARRTSAFARIRNELAQDNKTWIAKSA